MCNESVALRRQKIGKAIALFHPRSPRPFNLPFFFTQEIDEEGWKIWESWVDDVKTGVGMIRARGAEREMRLGCGICFLSSVAAMLTGESEGAGVVEAHGNG